jgi:TIR domain
MDHDVFLSYSTKDKTAAEAVCVALERRGVGVWMAPRDIPPGSSYAASIVEAIDSARVLVLIFSAAANGSQDIEREVQRADSKRLKIVPFRIEDVEPKASLAYFLPSRQYLDAFRPPMEARYDELSEVVRKIAPAAQPSPTPSGDVKPPPLPSPQRPQRFLPVLAGIVGLLVVSALVAWLLQRPNPAPEPTPVRPPPIASNDEPAPNPDKSAPRTASPANPSDSGNFSIIFGTESDPKSAMNEINTARQFPNSPHPVLYKKSGQWMSIVSFDTQEMRDQQLKSFKAKFPKADPKPLKLSSLCPNSRLVSAETADMAEQRDCGV